MLEAERAKLEVRRNFFTVRAVKPWNELPDATKKQSTINGFKNSYDTWKKKNNTTKLDNQAAVQSNSNIGNGEEM